MLRHWEHLATGGSSGLRASRGAPAVRSASLLGTLLVVAFALVDLDLVELLGIRLGGFPGPAGDIG